MPQRADLARGDARLHVGVGGRIAPVETDVQREAGLAACGDGTFGIPACQRERLLHEHMFTRARRGDDLRRVLRMRRGEHDGIDASVGQHVLVARREREAEARLERLLAGGIAGDRRGKGELVALAVYGLDQPRAPMPGSADRDAQHAILPFGRANRTGIGTSTVHPEPKPPRRRFPASSGAPTLAEPHITSLKALRAAEAACTRCPLYKDATQVVPGEGPCARAHHDGR